MQREQASQGRDSFLDIVRGIAILSVILVHSGASANAASLAAGGHGVPPLITGITDLGRFGVQLFFLLSGWLLENLYGSRTNVFSIRKFFVRRIARIYPLWLVFLVAGFLLPLLGLSTGIQRLTQASDSSFAAMTLLIVATTLTFTLWAFPSLWNTVIPGGWSIQAEIGHYFFFPVLRRLSIAGMIYLVAVMRLLTGIFYFSSQSLHNASFSYVLDAWLRLGLQNSLLYFVGGLLIGRWKKGQSEQWKGIFWPVLLIGFSLVISSDMLSEELMKIGFIFLALVSAAVISKTKALAAVFIKLGNYSYFIYFCHFVGLSLLDVVMRSAGFFSLISNSPGYSIALIPAYFTFSLLFSYSLAIASWRWFESPVIQLARKY